MTKLTRLQKFVIRNCGLVDTTAMADYLRVSPAELRQWMAALGLPEMRAIERSRAFPIILRRNHDLLPEEEIAELLCMPVEKLRKSMQEMDLLDVKLGEKPADLRPLAGSDADFPANVAEHFRMRCGQYFRDFDQWEQPFSFLDQLSVEEPLDTTQCRSATNTDLATRMMYSYTASHGDFLLTGEQFYTNGILSRNPNELGFLIDVETGDAVMLDVVHYEPKREFSSSVHARVPRHLHMVSGQSIDTFPVCIPVRCVVVASLIVLF